MAGFIVLEDGRAYAANNWSYDAVIERIARALPETSAGRALSDWLMAQRCIVRGAGLGSVDLEPNHSFAVVECEVIRDLKRSSMSLEPKGCERKCQKGPERHNETIAVSVPSVRRGKKWGFPECFLRVGVFEPSVVWRVLCSGDGK